MQHLRTMKLQIKCFQTVDYPSPVTLLVADNPKGGVFDHDLEVKSELLKTKIMDYAIPGQYQDSTACQSTGQEPSLE